MWLFCCPCSFISQCLGSAHLFVFQFVAAKVWKRKSCLFRRRPTACLMWSWIKNRQKNAQGVQECSVHGAPAVAQYTPPYIQEGESLARTSGWQPLWPLRYLILLSENVWPLLIKAENPRLSVPGEKRHLSTHQFVIPIYALSCSRKIWDVWAGRGSQEVTYSVISLSLENVGLITKSYLEGSSPWLGLTLNYVGFRGHVLATKWWQ